MSRNICKDKDEFFKAVFKAVIRIEGNVGDYDRLKDIPKDEYEDVMEENLYDIIGCFEINNVDVSTENVGSGGEYTDGGGIDGLQSLPTGELFWGFDCGGDWEVPLNAILYVEDGKPKLYVPEKGNNFCEKYMCAWGSESHYKDDDDEDCDECDEDDCDEDEHEKEIEQDEELKDIEDYFHNRAEGQHADGLNSVNADEHDKKPSDILEEILGVSSQKGAGISGLESLLKQSVGAEQNVSNEFYFVNTSIWCMRSNANGQNTVSANSSNAYPNVFKTYDEALDYAHLIMMINHNCQIHDFDKFKETIDIVENGEAPSGSEGYVHYKMENGIERFEGFDTNGHYPCLFDDITITKRTVYAMKNESQAGSPLVVSHSLQLEPVQLQHFIKGDTASEFTKEQSEDNQKAIERITKEMGGIDEMFDGDDKKQREFDKMKEMLGWSDEDEK